MLYTVHTLGQSLALSVTGAYRLLQITKGGNNLLSSPAHDGVVRKIPFQSVLPFLSNKNYGSIFVTIFVTS